MTSCPKCRNTTVIRVTRNNPTEQVERHGFVIALILLPVRFLRWLFRFLFVPRKQEFHKSTYFKCNYCGEQFDEPKLAPDGGMPNEITTSEE